MIEQSNFTVNFSFSLYILWILHTSSKVEINTVYFKFLISDSLRLSECKYICYKCVLWNILTKWFQSKVRLLLCWRAMHVKQYLRSDQLRMNTPLTKQGILKQWTLHLFCLHGNPSSLIKIDQSFSYFDYGKNSTYMYVYMYEYICSYVNYLIMFCAQQQQETLYFGFHVCSGSQITTLQHCYMMPKTGVLHWENKYSLGYVGLDICLREKKIKIN